MDVVMRVMAGMATGGGARAGAGVARRAAVWVETQAVFSDVTFLGLRSSD